MYRRLSLFTLLLFLPFSAQAITEEQLKEEVSKLHWSQGGSFPLSKLHATLTVPEKYVVAIAPDAKKYLELTNGMTIREEIDAVIVDTQTGDTLVFEPFAEGYVSFDDWQDMNPDQMLADMKEGDIEANKERAANGVPALNVTGWRQKPTLLKDSHEVTWAIDATEGSGSQTMHTTNATALLFGRYGYEKMIWVGDSSRDPAILMNEGKTAFAFDQESGYADYKEGDKTAAYGAAALVATAVGAKVAAKAGLFAFLLIFLKKAWILILLIPVALKKIFGKLTGKKVPEQAPPAPPSPPATGS